MVVDRQYLDLEVPEWHESYGVKRILRPHTIPGRDIPLPNFAVDTINEISERHSCFAVAQSPKLERLIEDVYEVFFPFTDFTEKNWLERNLVKVIQLEDTTGYIILPEACNAHKGFITSIKEGSLTYERIMEKLKVNDSIESLDNQEREIIKEAQHALIHSTVSPTILAYFLQIASINITGSFVSSAGLDVKSYINGLRDEPSCVLPFTGAPIRYKTTSECGDGKNVKDWASNKWYESESLRSPININLLVRNMIRLGEANVTYYSKDSKTKIAAAAAEPMISEFYRKITGKDIINSRNKLKRISGVLKEIGEVTDKSYYLKPFIDVYVGDGSGKITLSQVRNEAIHTGCTGLDLTGKMDFWGFMFYESLIKTLMTIVVDKPKIFNSYNRYCVSDVDLSKQCVSIDPNYFKKQNYEKNNLIDSMRIL